MTDVERVVVEVDAAPAQGAQGTTAAPADDGVRHVQRRMVFSVLGGVAAWIAACVPVLVMPTDVAGAVRAWWWPGSLAYLACFLGAILAPRAGVRRGFLLVQVVLGLVLLFGRPWDGLAPVLLVVTAIAVASEASLVVTVVVAAGQCVAIAAAVVLGTAPPDRGASVLLNVVLYAGLQQFGVMMVLAVDESERQRSRALALNARLSQAHDDLVDAHAQLAARHTELAAAQAGLAQASRTAERLRISRDLHDAVGHQLTALALHLEVAAHRAAGTPAADAVDECRGLVRDVLADVRSVVGRLRDPAADPGDLRARLAAVARRIDRPHVEVQVADDVPHLPPAIDEAVVRCAQEAMTNAARHSGAALLRVEVTTDDGDLLVRAHDDGRGAGILREGHGLSGMRERFADLGGVVTVTTAPGQGLRLVARVPLPADLEGTRP